MPIPHLLSEELVVGLGTFLLLRRLRFFFCVDVASKREPTTSAGSFTSGHLDDAL